MTSQRIRFLVAPLVAVLFQSGAVWSQDTNAATPLAAAVGQTVRLDPTDGFDAITQVQLRPVWRWIDRPAVSVAHFDDVNAIRPAVTIDVTGTYIAQLDLYGDDDTQPLYSTIVEISTENTAPVALITAHDGDQLTLDATSSYDVEGDALTYRWSIAGTPVNGKAEIADADAPQSQISFDVAGQYIVALGVSDAKGAEARTASYAVNVSADGTINTAPTADLGFDQLTQTQNIALDALQSTDNQGDSLTASLSIISTTDGAAQLITNDGGRSVLALTEGHDYLVATQVNDETSVGHDQMLISTNADVGVRPVAKITPVLTATVDEVLTLDGTQSYDLDSDQITYSWSISHAPAGSKATINNGPLVDFTPDQDGTYIAQLIVADDALVSVPRTIVISTDTSQAVTDAGTDQFTDVIPTSIDGLVQTLIGPNGTQLIAQQMTTAGAAPDVRILGNGNLPPMLAPQVFDAVKTGELVRLTSSAIDYNNDFINLRWSLLHKPTRSTLQIAKADNAAPLLDLTPDVPGLYLVQLAADDGALTAEPIVFAVNVLNSAPTAQIATIDSGFINTATRLDARGSFDRDDDPLRFSWALTSGPTGSAATIVDTTSPLATLTPDVKGDYQITLRASDGTDTDVQSVIFSVANRAPVAVLDGPATAMIDANMVISAAASTDPDGDALTYSFVITDPDGVVKVTESDDGVLNFVPVLQGAYEVAVTVADDETTAQSNLSVLIESTNNAPVLDELAADYTVEMGLELALDLAATDADGDAVTYFAGPLPLTKGMNVDAQTGALRFRPALGQIGTYILRVGASDGRSVAQTDITVNVVPAGAGETSIHGAVVMASDTGQALQGIPVQLANAGLKTVTDANGQFRFGSLTAGPDTLVINPPDTEQAQKYMTETRAVQVIANQDRDVAPAIFLTPVDQSCQQVIAGRDLVLNGPSGLQVTIAADTVRTVGGAPYQGDVCLGALPQNFAHPGLAETVDACQIYGLSAPNAQFTSPYLVSVPNADDLPNGALVDLLEMPRGGANFAFAGEATVTGDHVTASLYGEGLFSFVPQAHQVVQSGMMPTGNLRLSDLNGDLIQSYQLPTYMSGNEVQSLQLRYRSATADPVAIVAGDVTFTDNAGLPITLDSQLKLGGLQIADGPVWNVSNVNDAPLHQAMPVDVSGLPTGRYTYTFTSRANYSCSTIAAQYSGEVIVQNDIDSPVGQGWSVAGVQRLTQTATGAVTIMQDDQIASFDPKNAITSFENAPQIVQMSGASGIEAGDFDGNETVDIAILRDNGTRVVLSNLGNRAFDTLPETTAAIAEISALSMQAIGDSGVLAGKDDGLVPSLSTGEAQFDLLVADINGDNKKDVIFGRDDTLPDDVDLGVDGDSYTFIGRGDGSLQMFAQDGSAAIFNALVLADIDSDGSVDLISLQNGGVHIQYSTTGGAGIYEPRAGEFSTLVQLADGKWQRDMPDGTKVTFDPDGHMISALDQAGNGRNVSYENGQLRTITDAFGRMTTFRYTDDLLSNVTAPDGRQTNLSHSDGMLTRITGPMDVQTAYQYNTDGHLIGAVNADGHTTRFGFDEFGRLTKTTSPDGAVQMLQSAATMGLNAGQLVAGADVVSTFTDANGAVRNMKLNSFESVIEDTDALGRLTLTERDSNNLVTLTVSPSSANADKLRVDTFDYDTQGRLTQQTQATHTPQERTKSWQYDNAGHLIAQSDWAGAETFYKYEPNGYLAQVTDPLNAITQYTRTQLGLVADTTNANGNIAKNRYDTNGNLVETIDASGIATAITRDAAGNAVTIVAAVGTDIARTTTHSFDAANNLTQTSVTDATGDITATKAFTYLPSGLLLTQSEAGRETRALSYDAAGRILTEQQGTALTNYVYNALGNITEITRSNGADVIYDYDIAGRLTSQNDAAGMKVYTYDLADNIVQTTTPTGISTARFDTLGQMIGQTNPMGEETTQTFDMRGNVIAKMTADNQETTARYDALSRPVVIETTDNTRAFAYDALGNLVQAQDDDSRVTMTYDAQNRMKTATTDGFIGRQPDVVLTYSYDALGRQIAMQDSVGGAATAAYDATDQMIRQTTAWGVTYANSFDDMGRMTEQRASSGRLSEMAFDADGITSLAHAQASVDLSNWTMTYANGGLLSHIVAEGDAVGTAQILYDDHGRVLQIAQGSPAIPVEDYAYGDNGQLIASHRSSRFAYNSLGHVIDDDHYRYEYDQRGNMISRQDSVNGSEETFRYDGENQLIGYTSPTASIGYAYDAFGRLIGRTTPDSEQAYIHDASCVTDCAIMVFDVDNGASLTQRWTYNTDGTPLSFENYGRGSVGGSGSNFELFFDPTGTDLSIVDPVSNDIVARFDFDSSGALIDKQGKVDLLPHMFDLTTGLNVLGTRTPSTILATLQ